MRIAVDARAYFQRTGVARYTRELLGALSATDRAHDLLFLISDHHSPAEVLHTNGRTEVRVSRAPWLGGAEERRVLTREVRDWGADLFHSVFPPVVIPRVPTVVTVLDTTPLTHPHLHQPSVVRAFLHGAGRAFCAATHLVTPSRATARHVHHVAPSTVRRSSVIPCGLSRAFASPSAGAARGQRRRAGVLYVGTLEPRKNVPLLLEALRRLRRLGHRGPVTVVGKMGWGREPIDDVRCALSGARYLGYVSDAELCRLYRRHAVFAYLSEVEGFGLPVLEAMAHGALPIVSRDPALRELVDDAELSVDPANPDQVARSLEYWLTHAAHRSRKTRILARRAKGFTWERAARETVAVWERAVS